MSPAAGEGRPRVAVVADDLIWGSRLVESVRRAGGEPVAVRTERAIEAGLTDVAGVIVDTTARAYDPIAVLRTASARGIPAIAVAPHVAIELRRAAREAGASRVHPYQVLFERAERELGAWLRAIEAKAASPRKAGARKERA